MIVKNEGETLRRALESARPFVDEIVVSIDSLSKDDSRQIALELADTVTGHKWGNDFSKARNGCIAQAKHDWIFTLDGHEYIEEGIEKLKWLKTQELEHDVCIMEVHHKVKLRETLNEQPRLFRKKYKYYNACHNVLVFDHDKAVKVSDVMIGHKRDESLMENRNVQRKEMNVQDLVARIAEGDRRAMTQLASEYMAYKEWSKAIKAYKIYLKEAMMDKERYQVYVKLAMCYYWNKRIDLAEQALWECSLCNEDNRNAHFVFLGALYNKIGNYHRAKEVLTKALETFRPAQFYFLYPKFYYDTPFSLLKIVEKKINDYNKFKSHYQTEAQPDR